MKTHVPAPRPTICIDPGHRFGAPQIHDIPTARIADLVYAGRVPADLAYDYHLTRDQVLLACWYETVRPGATRRLLEAWADWATTAEIHLAQSDPPDNGLVDPPRRAA